MNKYKYILIIPLLFTLGACSTDDNSSSVNTPDSFSSEPVEYEWNDATYTWNTDNSKVLASRTRKDDETVVESEEVGTTYTVLVAPTCTSIGEGKYTSDAFTNEAFSVQTKNVDINMTDHNYGEVDYSWNSDNSKCTASISCTNPNCDHELEETVDSIYNVETEPTCHSLGVGRYSASFTNPLFSSTYKDEDIEMTSHTYVGTPTYEWNNDKSQCTASINCINDGCTHIESETVNSSIYAHVDATCVDDGYTTYEVIFTNPLFSRQETTVDIDSLGTEHNWQFVSYISLAYFDEYYNTVPGDALYRCSHCNAEKHVEHYQFDGMIPLD